MKPSDREKLFRKLKSGDGRALVDLVDADRSMLYDYLMRMTGQVTRSAETIDEVLQGLNGESLMVLSGWREFRIMLFSTARRFSADIWNADTAMLSNAALDVDDNSPMDERQLRERQAFKALDKSLRNLGGTQREAVALRARYGFELHEAAEVMGVVEADADALFLDGMQRVDAECSGQVEGPEAMLHAMPSHPLPIRSSQATVNLSMVMEGIKTKPVGLNSPARIVLMLLFAAAAATYLLYPQAFKKLFAVLGI